MDITKYEAIAEKCEENSSYFASIDFFKLAASFKEAAAAITEMAGIIRKVDNMSAEEGANE